MVCDVVAMFYLQGDRGLSLIFNGFFHRSLLRAQRVEDRNQNLAMMRMLAIMMIMMVMMRRIRAG